MALTIVHADGSAVKPFLADSALSVHQLLHQLLLAGALSVDDATKLAFRVASSSPRRPRPIDNMEETLGGLLAHQQSGCPRFLRWLLRSEELFMLYVMP